MGWKGVVTSYLLIVAMSCADRNMQVVSSQTRGLPGDANRSEEDLVVSTCLAGGGPATHVYDAREFYPWASVGKLYGVASWNPRRHAFAATFLGAKRPVCLTGASKEVLADFLSKQFHGTFPGLQSADSIGRFLKDVVLPQGSVVGDEKLLRRRR
jgi:hypothetical protein